MQAIFFSSTVLTTIGKWHEENLYKNPKATHRHPFSQRVWESMREIWEGEENGVYEEWKQKRRKSNKNKLIIERGRLIKIALSRMHKQPHTCSRRHFSAPLFSHCMHFLWVRLSHFIVKTTVQIEWIMCCIRWKKMCEFGLVVCVSVSALGVLCVMSSSVFLLRQCIDLLVNDRMMCGSKIVEMERRVRGANFNR